MGRVATAILVAGAACASERTASQPRDRSRLEHAIEEELGARVHVPLRVRCVWLPPSCRAKLPDGSELPLRLGVTGGEIVWRLDGALVLADDLEAYLRDALVDLGAPQAARCGARIQSIAVNQRVECALERGGKAFVLVNPDGTTSVEIDVDPAAGSARSEGERDDLLEMSRKLEHAEDEDSE